MIEGLVENDLKFYVDFLFVWCEVDVVSYFVLVSGCYLLMVWGCINIYVIFSEFC